VLSDQFHFEDEPINVDVALFCEIEAMRERVEHKRDAEDEAHPNGHNEQRRNHGTT